jgi:hypothetical protein
MNEHQRDEILIDLHRSMGEVCTKLNDFEDKFKDHTGRIQLIEGEVKTHADWRAKVIGIYIGISIATAVVAAGVSTLISLWKK